MSICTCISDRQKKIDKLCEYHNPPISQEAARGLLEAAKRARLLLGMIPTNSKAYAPDTMAMLEEAITAAEKGE